MMIYDERKMRAGQALDIAQKMAVAARTAPKGKGVDVIECAVVDGEDVERIAVEMERIAEEIEQNLQNSLEREISSRKIGELVMDRLKGVDEVAYVRFASVYRQFKDINTFMTELNKLLAERT